MSTEEIKDENLEAAAEETEHEEAVNETPNTDEQAETSEETAEAAETEEEPAEEGSEEAEADDGADGLDTVAKLELKKKDEQIKNLTDRYQRALAEYQNYRNRTEREKADIYTFAVKDVMTKILPVLDNLERGLSQIPEDARDEAFAQGMVQLQKQFEKSLTDIGVEPIAAVGEKFDPDFHNAVMAVEQDGAEADTVVSEFQKGYTYKGAVIRHSMVQVAK